MREKKKTLDKNNDNLKLKKRVKKQKLKERGITLIALVVTIIILLILAGVTLNIALSDNGLFSKAKKATEDYEQAQSEEEDLISQIATQMYSEYVGATVTGYNLEQKSVTIEGTTSGLENNKKDDQGNTFDGVEEDGSQIFETDTGMSWRVWDYDGNILRIIGDPTDSKLKLTKANGYNNGVWALDYICKELYENGKKGVTATNLKRSDIQKVSTYDYTKYKHKPDEYEEDTTSGDNNSIYFGSSKTYVVENIQYPDMWNENDKNWNYEYSKDNGTIGEDKEGKKWEEIGKGKGKIESEMNIGNSNMNFKQSYYVHDYKQSEFIDDVYYNLIFKKLDGGSCTSYWLGCRGVRLMTTGCSFGLQCIYTEDGNDEISDSTLVDSKR